METEVWFYETVGFYNRKFVNSNIDSGFVIRFFSKDK